MVSQRDSFLSSVAGISQIVFLRRGVAQSGSALAWGARGRWFEPSRPDQSDSFGGSGNEARIGLCFSVTY